MSSFVIPSTRSTRGSSRRKPALKPSASRTDLRNGTTLSTAVASSDLRISFPASDRIRFFSAPLFSDPHSTLARQFFERAFLAPEVTQVEIDGDRQKAEISFRADDASNRGVIKKISRLLGDGQPSD